jgi:hypothetical protein
MLMTATRSHRNAVLARCAVLALAATSAVGVSVAAGPTASASSSCSASVIRINTGGGGERASWAMGHRHRTGNHYIKRRSGNVLHWWADNNGGLDGDTRDTAYRVRVCGG